MYTREINLMDEMNVQIEPAKAIQDAHTSPFLDAEWLASLSHELRGPLTAIQGYANMLIRHEERISSEERHEFLRAITKGSERIASVLDSFFDIANLEAGTTQLRLFLIDVAQLVQEVLLVQQQEHPANTISLTLNHETDPTLPFERNPFVMQADSSLMRKMLIQLLDNAQKYSVEGTPIEVTLSCTSLQQRLMDIPPQIQAQFQDPDQQFIELSIHDQGIGIPTRDHERIFRRFERLNLQLTREVSGLGLGLTICKYIVALHHGAIWVKSMPGKGSIFHVLFPVEYDNR